MNFVGGRERKFCSKRRQRFEQLTRIHIDALWGVALRMTGLRDVADDLTQEACLKAYKSFDQFEPGTNYKAWLFKILVNLCRDFLRKENKAPFKAWDNEEVDETVFRNGEKRCQPETQLQQKRFYAEAIEAMAVLPADVRLIVCLSLLDGLSYQEIADAENIPIGTVRSRLSRGRKQLQKLLRAHVETEELPSATSRQRLSVRAAPLVLLQNKEMLK